MGRCQPPGSLLGFLPLPPGACRNQAPDAAVLYCCIVEPEAGVERRYSEREAATQPHMRFLSRPKPDAAARSLADAVNTERGFPRIPAGSIAASDRPPFRRRFSTSTSRPIRSKRARSHDATARLSPSGRQPKNPGKSFPREALVHYATRWRIASISIGDRPHLPPGRKAARPAQTGGGRGDRPPAPGSLPSGAGPRALLPL